MRRYLATIRKAIVSAAAAAVASLGTAMLDGDITGKERVIALGMGLIAGAATYRVPNADAVTREVPSIHDDPEA